MVLVPGGYITTQRILYPLLPAAWFHQTTPGAFMMTPTREKPPEGNEGMVRTYLSPLP